ncbi:MAG: copper homeostasis protein CutC [Planctomycetes bacterium]|nr:copper homeostasis protein CutC [Planctomycetota bacterium]
MCTESLDGALAARRGGAERVELCAALGVGGLTPSLGTLRLVRERTSLAVVALARPRAGDFLYGANEFDVLRRDVELLGEAGAHGVALGVLTPDGRIDVARTGRLVEAARPMQVVFHRAFDMLSDQFAALDELAALGVSRVLTSGGAPSVVDGLPRLRELVAAARGRLTVMPGGGVRADNVREVLARSGAREVHFSARRTARSQMRYVHEAVSLDDHGDDAEWTVTDEARVRAIVQAARG